MNIEEQDKELSRLRQYIMQIDRYNASTSPRVLASWELDAVFVRYVNAATELISKAQDSADKLRACTHDDYIKLSKVDRFRLLTAANKIRELDEDTEQSLFVVVSHVKRELNTLRKSSRAGEIDKKLAKKYAALFALLTPQAATIMTDSYIRGMVMRNIAQAHSLSTSRIGDIIREAVQQLEIFNKEGVYEEPKETAI